MFLYVLCDFSFSSGGDCFTKIGIAKSPRSRIQNLNAGNPLQLQLFRLFKFSELEHARDVEKSVLEAASQQGLVYKGKRELLSCPPSWATGKIIEISQKKDYEFIPRYPISDSDKIVALNSNFGINYQNRPIFSSYEEDIFLCGVAHAIDLVSMLSEFNVSREELIQLSHSAFGKRGFDFWRSFIEVFQLLRPNMSEQDREKIRVIERRIERRQIEEYQNWVEEIAE